LLWDAPPAAQQEVPAGPDVQYFEAYRRSEPITQWPLKKTLHEIRELAGLEPATDQARLPAILRRVSGNLQNFVTNFVNTASLETIEETRREGWRTPEHIVERFRYLMLAPQESNARDLIEYRTDLRGREQLSHGLIENFIKTTGFASIPLFFGPLQQPRSDFRYLGEQTIHGRRAEVVAFAQHVEPLAVRGRFVHGKTSVPLLLQGVAWIYASDYQVLRMRTDLLAPQPAAALRRLTTVVSLALIAFEGGRAAFWLPREVDVTVEQGNYTFFNRHRYSDYRLFKVEILRPARDPDPTAAQHP
jgi:hypothetical protein